MVEADEKEIVVRGFVFFLRPPAGVCFCAQWTAPGPAALACSCVSPSDRHLQHLQHRQPVPPQPTAPLLFNIR